LITSQQGHLSRHLDLFKGRTASSEDFNLIEIKHKIRTLSPTPVLGDKKLESWWSRGALGKK
jgi:hypothetical protein